MGSTPDARRAAFRILQTVRQGQPFNQARDAAVGSLEERDRRLAHELAAGVLRHQQSLDATLSPLVTRPWGRVSPVLQDILRLGAYQLQHLDRIPHHAAVDETVSLAREVAGQPSAGLVNAVLRKLATAGSPDRRTAGPRGPDVESLARTTSHPVWLVVRWLVRFGPDETRALLAWNNTRPRLVVQPARVDLQTLTDQFHRASVPVAPAPFDAGLVIGRRRPESLPGFADGAFVVQDPAHALVSRFAQFKAGTVYDTCASPGGKTIALGRAGLRVIAGDRTRGKVVRLAQNLERAGSGREFVVAADGHDPPLRPVDGVLLDAPCLGTGTLARHPDARLRLDPRGLDDLVRLQEGLLESVARLVRGGGTLVYATCSLEPEENECQVQKFLGAHPEFRRSPPDRFPTELMSPQGDLTILPQRQGMDGAFAARLVRDGP